MTILIEHEATEPLADPCKAEIMRAVCRVYSQVSINGLANTWTRLTAKQRIESASQTSEKPDTV